MFGIDSLATDFGEAAVELLGMLMTWWLVVPSPLEQVKEVPGPNNVVAPLALLILAVSLLTQLGRLMISGRREPLVEVGLGLLKFALVNAAALFALNIALEMGDAATEELLGNALPEFNKEVGNAFAHAPVGSGLKLVVALVMVLLGLIQWLFLLFRQGTILVLVALLPLAAAGVLTNATRRWLPTMVAWLIGLVVYKPLAALIYAIGLGLVSKGEDVATGGGDFVAALTGVVVLLIAVFALPAVMKFFSWAQVGVGGGGSVGGVIAGAATGAVSMGALGSSRRQEMTGPGSAPGWTQSAASPPGVAAQKALPAGGAGGSGRQGAVRSPEGGGGSAGRVTPSAAGGGASGAGAGAVRGGASAGGPAAGQAAGAAAGGAAVGGAAAAAGPAGAAAAAAGSAVQKGRAAAENFASPPQDLGGAAPSKGPDGAGPAGQGGNQ